MPEQHRIWPLYVVTDLRQKDGTRLGEVIQGDHWELRGPSPSEVDALPLSRDIRDAMSFWLEELQNEVDAANGAHTGAPALTVPRMEWRRVLHNNNLRIGPAENRPTRIAA